MSKLLVTGGAGFIGSNFVRYWVKNHPNDQILILDALTYAGHLSSLKGLISDQTILNIQPEEGLVFDLNSGGRLSFVKADITNLDLVTRFMVGIDIVVHFAAESHVDRSVLDPFTFVKTNVLGTAILLQAALDHQVKRFHHVSTDEVFGDLTLEEAPFTENNPIDPRSPYAASKASSDLLAMAYFKTYQLPVTVSNTANNYGPFHDPEKLIPRFITNLLDKQKVPLMGQGENIRDWLYVEDHCRAIDLILEKGIVGERYCVGGNAEATNLAVTKMILQELGLGEEMIEFVQSRLGHDFRYAIDSTKMKKLGWEPTEDFKSGLKKTIDWYKANEWWWRPFKQNRPNVDGAVQKASISK